MSLLRVWLIVESCGYESRSYLRGYFTHQLQVQDTSSGNLARDVQERGRERESHSSVNLLRFTFDLLQSLRTGEYHPVIFIQALACARTPSPFLRSRIFHNSMWCEMHPRSYAWISSTHLHTRRIRISDQVDLWCSLFKIFSGMQFNSSAWQVVESATHVYGALHQLVISCVRFFKHVIQVRGRLEALFLSLNHRWRHYAEALHLWNRVVLPIEVVQPHCMIYCKFHSNSVRLSIDFLVVPRYSSRRLRSLRQTSAQ